MDYSEEPPHSTCLFVRGDKPWNAEPCAKELVMHPYTPEELMYCRNHGPVPQLDEAKFTVKIDGLVEHEAEYTLKDLMSKFPKFEVVAALECAGNRRKRMVEKKKRAVAGLLWEEGTVCNAKWGGARLRDILLHSKVQPRSDADGEGKLHVCFASHVTLCEDDSYYGTSVPLSKIMEDGDALLAYEVHDKLLSPDHGYPFRIVIPGYSGVRWVKWVDQITVARRESQNFYQQKDYKILPPTVNTHKQAEAEEWWSKLPAIQENPLNSAVTAVEVCTSGSATVLHAKGYAIAGPSGQVSKVDISIDEGQTWHPTSITYQEGKWSWTLWEGVIDLENRGLSCAQTNGRNNENGVKPQIVMSRAVDENGNEQAMDVAWNLRGVAFTAVGEANF